MNENSLNIDSKTIQRFVPFDELTESALETLRPHFRAYQVEPRKIVFKRGQADDECHFLVSGELDLADEQFRVTKVYGDDVENFLALDASHSIHRCAAISQTACQLIALKRSHFELISTWISLAQSQPAADTLDWLEALLTSNLFSRIPPANIQKLITSFHSKPVSLGDVIIHEGEENGSECYVIKQGNALVSRKVNGQVETIAALTHGALFGEDALISNLPRNATITMSSDGELMAIAKEDFDTLLKQPVLHYISDNELAALITDGDTGTVIVDVRQEYESAAAPIHRARAIPLAQLRHRLHELAKDFIYVLVGGRRAEAAAYIFHEAGYDARVLRSEDQ